MPRGGVPCKEDTGCSAVLVEQDLDQVDHRLRVLGRAEQPGDLICDGAQCACHRDRAFLSLQLRDGWHIALGSERSPTIFLHSKRSELVDEVEELVGLEILKRVEKLLALL